MRLLRSFFRRLSPSIPLSHRDVQMEAGGDTTAPAPGDVEDLEDNRFPSELAGNGGGLHEDPPDPGDGDLEETGMTSPH